MLPPIDPRPAASVAVVNAGPPRRGSAASARLRRSLVAAEILGGVLVLGVTFALFFADRTLPQYVDEADNFLGGLMIARGYRLYVDFFSQHMPFPYYATALASLFGAHDMLTYRAIFAVVIALVLGGIIAYFRRWLPTVLLWTLVFSIGLGHPIFSGYMVLADHFFALALLIVVLFVLAKDVDFSLGDQLAISACCFVAVQSTLISIYPLALIAVFYVLRKWPQLGWSRRAWRPEVAFVALLAAPHLALVAVLVQQDAFASLVDQAVVFNQQYYSRYDIGGDPIGILRNSMADFGSLAERYLRPSGWREVETVLLVSNIGAAATLVKTRGKLFGLFYVGLVLLSRMRGPGYHGSPYFVVSFLSMAILVAQAVEALLPLALSGAARSFGWSWVALISAPRRSLVPAGPRTPSVGQPWLQGLRVPTLGLLAAYLAWAALFYHDIGGFYLHLPRGQGLETPYTRVVAAATEPADRIWAAPFEPSLYVETNRLPASPYAYYHPWLADSPAITAGLLRDLRAVRPPVVVFKADWHIPWAFPLPVPAEFGREVFAYIQQEYVALDPADPVLRDVYLRRSELDTLRARLTQRGFSVPSRAD